MKNNKDNVKGCVLVGPTMKIYNILDKLFPWVLQKKSLIT